jgi:NTF2-related export protein 1/2
VLTLLKSKLLVQVGSLTQTVLTFANGIVAAQDFVDGYYSALNNLNGRANIAGFYVKETPGSPLKADIVLNGVTYSDPKEVQNIFEQDVRAAHYVVDDFDYQIINLNYNVGAPATALGLDKDGKKISILVIISGSVRYGEQGEVRGFTDNVILVPNWESHSPKAAKGLNKWLVGTQNFRLVYEPIDLQVS